MFRHFFLAEGESQEDEDVRMELDIKNYINRHSSGSKVVRVLWNGVWLSLFRPTPRDSLFRPWRMLLLKLFGAKVRWSAMSFQVAGFGNRGG